MGFLYVLLILAIFLIIVGFYFVINKKKNGDENRELRLDEYKRQIMSEIPLESYSPDMRINGLFSVDFKSKKWRVEQNKRTYSFGDFDGFERMKDENSEEKKIIRINLRNQPMKYTEITIPSTLEASEENGKASEYKAELFKKDSESYFVSRDIAVDEIIEQLEKINHIVTQDKAMNISEETINEIMQYKQLLDQHVITDEEFDKMRKNLMDSVQVK